MCIYSANANFHSRSRKEMRKKKKTNTIKIDKFIENNEISPIKSKFIYRDKGNQPNENKKIW